MQKMKLRDSEQQLLLLQSWKSENFMYWEQQLKPWLKPVFFSRSEKKKGNSNHDSYRTFRSPNYIKLSYILYL